MTTTDAARPAPTDDRQLVPLHVEGLPVTVFCAMIEGIERRYPGTKWVIDHPYGDGPFVIALGGPYVEDVDDD